MTAAAASHPDTHAGIGAVSHGAAPTKTLSRREEEILRLIEGGLSNKTVAHDLGITTATVEAHVSNIFRKLRVENRMQAVNAWRDARNARKIDSAGSGGPGDADDIGNTGEPGGAS